MDCAPSICSTTKEASLVPLSYTRETRMPSSFSNNLLGDSSRSLSFQAVYPEFAETYEAYQRVMAPEFKMQGKARYEVDRAA